jgi:hypothetical protein
MFTQKIAEEVNYGILEQYAARNFMGSSGTLGAIVTALLPYVFIAAGLLLLFNLILGGFGVLSSGGNPKNIEAGKSRITYALIGFVVVFFAYWLIQIVAYATGLGSIFEIFGTAN